MTMVELVITHGSLILPEMEEITGFDEGPLHPRWREELNSRGIDFQENVMWSEALKVFEKYRDSGAPVYNARGNK